MIRRPHEMKIEERERMRGGEGKVAIRHLLNKEDFKGKVRLCAHLTLPPGAGIGMHEHPNEDEVFAIIKGSGTHDDGKSRTRVSAGDVTLTGNGASHSIINDGKEALEIIAVIICC